MTTNTTLLRLISSIFTIIFVGNICVLSQNTEDLFTLPGLRFAVDVTDDIFSISNNSLFYRGDTIYNGDRILIYQHFQGQNYYIKIDQDKVYEARYSLDQETIVQFDFGLNVGDTIDYKDLWMASFGDVTLTVTEKSTIQLDDQINRIKMKLDFEGSNSSINWVQGIGYEDWGPIIYYNSTANLKCVSSDSGDIYLADDFSAEECDKSACLVLSAYFEIDHANSKDGKVVLLNYAENYEEVEVDMGDGTVFTEFPDEYEYIEKGCYEIGVTARNSCGVTTYRKKYFDYCKDPKWYSKGEKKFNKISFSSSVKGYGLVQDSIFRTMDGGESWVFISRLFEEENTFYSWGNLNFENDNLAIATARSSSILNHIFLSQDGGEHWDLIYDGPLSIRRVSIDSDGTILATSSNKLIRSTDFGENWTEIEREETSWAYDLSEFANSTVATVDRTLQSPPNNYLAQVSKDNGLTWKTSIFENFISSIHFVNENIGFVGGAGEIFKTTDGGDNWQSVETFTTQSSIHDFHFINEEEGFAVNGEQIFKTNDGGQTWNLEYCKNIHLPKQIFANEETAFVLIRSKLYERIPNPDYDCEDVNSVPQLKEIEIDIYPNPAQNHFQILSELTGSVQIEIRNLNGKILKKSSVLNNAPIDISTIANGLYFVTIKNDNLKKTLRLIKL